MALLRAFQVRNRINQFKRHFVIILTSYPLQGWQRARVDGDERRFCARHQISSSTMEMVTGMRTQLLGQLRASGFVRAKGPGDIRDLNKNSENWAVVKAALVAGSYPNLARSATSRDTRQRNLGTNIFPLLSGMTARPASFAPPSPADAPARGYARSDG